MGRSGSLADRTKTISIHSSNSRISVLLSTDSGINACAGSHRLDAPLRRDGSSSPSLPRYPSMDAIQSRRNCVKASNDVKPRRSADWCRCRLNRQVDWATSGSSHSTEWPPGSESRVKGEWLRCAWARSFRLLMASAYGTTHWRSFSGEARRIRSTSASHSRGDWRQAWPKPHGNRVALRTAVFTCSAAGGVSSTITANVSCDLLRTVIRRAQA